MILNWIHKPAVEMSAEPLIRELFRGLETTIHERLGMIEQVLHSVEKPKVPLYDSEFIARIERLERVVERNATDNQVLYNHNDSLLEERITALEENLASLFADVEALKENRRTMATLVMPSPILPLRTHEVDMMLTGDEKLLDEEPPVGVDEKVVDEEPPVEVDEDAEEEEEEEEEEGLTLENLEEYNPKYKGKNLYKDEDNNVYLMDEDGNISEPVGTWNGKKFIPTPR